MMITIHQPEHLPWLGFIDKISRADVFVLLDNVQYRKNYFQNRNKVIGPNGPVWITVPVLTKGRFGQTIDGVEINNAGEHRWREKYWATLTQAYQKARFWEQYSEPLRQLLLQDWAMLTHLNSALIQFLIDSFGVRTRIVKASELKAEGQSSDLILEICRELGAKTYISGVSGRDYLDLKSFDEAHIEVVFQAFYHPIYSQLHAPFQPFLSSIDLLFNAGPGSLEVVVGEHSARLDYVLQ